MKKRLFKVLLVLLISIIVFSFLIKFLNIIHFKCLFKYLFNFYCAGCGTTRMIESIFKLEFYQAFRYNPLMFILIIFMIIYILYFIYNYIFKNKIILPNFKMFIIIIIILFIYMILRNISCFKYLAPTNIKK